jgi:hypothetical protein
MKLARVVQAMVSALKACALVMLVITAEVVNTRSAHKTAVVMVSATWKCMAVSVMKAGPVLTADSPVKGASGLVFGQVILIIPMPRRQG